MYSESQENAYLQLARRAAEEQEKKGNTELAKHIITAASQWVLAKREIKEIMRKHV